MGESASIVRFQHQRANQSYGQLEGTMLRQMPAFQLRLRGSTRSGAHSLPAPPQPFGRRAIALVGNLELSFWDSAVRPGLQSDQPRLCLGSRVTKGAPRMFSFFGKKPDYEAIFVSDDATQKLIYGDRSKTSKVLGDEAFVDAWLASRHMSRVSNLIRREALKGDIPSIKQMIWLGDVIYRDSASMPDATRRAAYQKSVLQERILFCEKAISLGMPEKSYQAMVSSANLYTLMGSSVAVTDELIQSTLSGIIRNAKLFLSIGCDDPGLIEDANNVLAKFEPLANVMSALVKKTKAQESLEIRTEADIERLMRDQGLDEGGRTMRKLAHEGNLMCQIALSQFALMMLAKHENEQLRQDCETFTKLAAEQGDPSSQFNLAKIYFDAVDGSDGYLYDHDFELIKKAKFWHRKAAAQGFQDSIKQLKELESAFPD